MTPATHWKTQAADLHRLAQSVHDVPVGTERMSARTCARCLSGIVSLVSRRWSVDLMQATCAELVRHDDAWGTTMVSLPVGERGESTEATQLIAVVARALIPVAGAANVRAALSFWATEDSPTAWTAIVQPE